MLHQGISGRQYSLVPFHFTPHLAICCLFVPEMERSDLYFFKDLHADCSSCSLLLSYPVPLQLFLRFARMIGTGP